MKITGLSGKSGTGKSYAAGKLAIDIGADAIIDDGLLIAEGRIIAGKSAKKQATKIGAVKTAVFTEDDHAELVKKGIADLAPSHLLILGTSDNMIKKICQRLELSAPDRLIHIEDITTEQQRAIARKSRVESGMHTIPAPAFQIRKNFSGFVINPKRAFKAAEKRTRTIIRPSYSYLGSYEINDRIIGQIAEHVVSITPGCQKLIFANSTNTEDGCYIRVIINADLEYNIIDAAETLQKRMTQAVAHITSLTVLGVEVEIRGYK